MIEIKGYKENGMHIIEMKYLNKINYFLGLEITSSFDGYYLS